MVPRLGLNTLTAKDLDSIHGQRTNPQPCGVAKKKKREKRINNLSPESARVSAVTFQWLEQSIIRAMPLQRKLGMWSICVARRKRKVSLGEQHRNLAEA